MESSRYPRPPSPRGDRDHRYYDRPDRYRSTRYRRRSRSPSPKRYRSSRHHHPSYHHQQSPSSSYRRPYQPSRRHPSQPNPPPPMRNKGPSMSKACRLYVGNVPFAVGLTDEALAHMFSALFVAGFGPNKPGQELPVRSFWLHGDGKFGFMEVRGEQEAVDMMQFHGVILHGRALKVNRPTDYRGGSGGLVPTKVNADAVVQLCDKLGNVVDAPAGIRALATTPRIEKEEEVDEEKKERVVIHPQENNNEKKELDQHRQVVVVLKNLVTEEDLEADEEDFQDLLQDVESECSNYGSVKRVVIPKKGPWALSVVVQYGRHTDAVGAVKALKQKVFDKRRIDAHLMKSVDTAADAIAQPPPQ